VNGFLVIQHIRQQGHGQIHGGGGAQGLDDEGNEYDPFD
jgi:hypothetical protein